MFKRDLRPFFNYERLLFPFLLWSICVGLFVNAIYQFLLNSLVGLLGWWWPTQDSTIPETLTSLTIAVLSAGCVLLAFRFLGRTIAQANRAPVDAQAKPPYPRRGLILLVSDRDTDVCRAAFVFHAATLRKCWLICSERSKPLADQFRKEHPDKCEAEPIVIQNVMQPLDVYHAVRGIIDNLPWGWHRDDVIADYTGMTAHCSVGMALACLLADSPMQYTLAKSHDDQGRPDKAGEPIEVQLRLRRQNRKKPLAVDEWLADGSPHT